MSAGPWSCPTCLRTVPARVDECYCGTTREAAERAARNAAPEPGGGGRPWIPLVLVAGAVALLIAGLREDPAPPPPPAATPAPGPAATRPPPFTPYPESARRLLRPEPTVIQPAPAPTSAPPIPAPAAPPPPEPEPTPPEEEQDGLEARREEAARALEQTLGRVAARRDDLEERLRAWDASCGSSTSAVRPAGCELLQEDIEEFLAEIEAGLADSDREARRGWVTPGVRRELRARFELEDATWARLRSRAQAALR